MSKELHSLSKRRTYTTIVLKECKYQRNAHVLTLLPAQVDLLDVRMCECANPCARPGAPIEDQGLQRYRFFGVIFVLGRWLRSVASAADASVLVS